jgi:putative ABC transport system substrate-binding protein
MIRLKYRILPAGVLVLLLAMTLALPCAQAARRAPAPAAAPAPQAAPEAPPAEPVALPEQAPLDKQIELIRKVLPQAKRVGVIYNPRQPIAAAAIKQLLELFPKAGLTLVDITAQRRVDVGPAARNLIGRVDLIYTIFDDNVAAEYATLAKACDEARIPLFAADPVAVRRGAMASLGLSSREKDVVPPPPPPQPATGKQGARAPESRPRPVVVPRLLVYLNTDAAARQGVSSIPEAVLKGAVIVGNPAGKQP